MRYMTLTIHGDVDLEEALKKYAELDWRLHTVALIRTLPAGRDDGALGLTNVWHVVMEKGTF